MFRVVMTTGSEQFIEDRDECDIVQISVNGEKVFDVGDGDPEDNCLCRNFNSCYSILDLLEEAYNAGRDGEEAEFIAEEIDELPY